MKYEELLTIVGDEPVFETGFLLAGGEAPAAIRKQLSRWEAAGRIQQLRRGLYTLAPPYRKTQPHPFLVSNSLAKPSYVSCESALAYFGMLPESVPAPSASPVLAPANGRRRWVVFAFTTSNASSSGATPGAW